jgi:uncharacterized RDD family membrane protein YckC
MTEPTCAAHGGAIVRSCARCQAPMCARCVSWGQRILCCPACPFHLRPAASIARRIGAHALDSLSFVAPVVVVIVIGLWLATDDQLAPRSLSEVPLREVNGWSVLAALSAPFVLQLVMQLSAGRSLGKWVAELRVVDERGGPVNPVILFLGRNVGPLVLYGLCGIIPLIDLVMFFIPPHQRWRDKVLGLRVIDDPRDGVAG